jgi:hypothetical protein
LWRPRAIHGKQSVRPDGVDLAAEPYNRVQKPSVQR